MNEDKFRDAQSPTPLNVVSDETGQLDPHFMLWRRFCAENNIDVNTLPSQLSNEAREKWHKLKKSNLS